LCLSRQPERYRPTALGTGCTPLQCSDIIDIIIIYDIIIIIIITINCGGVA